MNDDTIFESHRPRLLALAYRLLGARSDAEDVVGDAHDLGPAGSGAVRGIDPHSPVAGAAPDAQFGRAKRDTTG